MGKYGVVLADPPWQYSNSGIGGSAASHYDTMNTSDICALPVIEMVKKDAVLLLWATWPMLVDATSVIDAWGFEYKTGMPWVKLNGIPQMTLWGEVSMRPYWGQGWWIRGVSEPLLVCVRGNAKYPDDPPMGLISERFEHSRKPDNVYEYAELFPGPYLELFARRARSGWDVWGNEVESTIALN